jgi:hypothetical protein
MLSITKLNKRLIFQIFPRKRRRKYPSLKEFYKSYGSCKTPLKTGKKKKKRCFFLPLSLSSVSISQANIKGLRDRNGRKSIFPRKRRFRGKTRAKEKSDESQKLKKKKA